MMKLRCGVVCGVLAMLAGGAWGQAKNDVNPEYKAPAEAAKDYEKRVVMIPMRDGVKLYTVIVIPKAAIANKGFAPMVLTRTCYNAAGRASRSDSPKMVEALPLADEEFVKAGYIRVYQDVRGKYGSEGVYLMTPPPVASGFNPTGADDTTDGYDTIDWLSKNVPESNGRVGMIGSSYEGFTVVMALLHPHPMLKVTAPESPMVNGWMGDDWFHYGAYREADAVDYIVGQMAQRGSGAHVEHAAKDDYTNDLLAGNAEGLAREAGAENMGYWKLLVEHTAYDAFWQSQALETLIAKTPLTVPTMWEQGLWDQEDMWGANHAYRAWESQDKKNDMNFLVMGPWFHSQINRQGRGLGPFVWSADTALEWRRDVLLPFFNQYLQTDGKKADTPPVWVYNTGEDHWDRLQAWPASCEQGCGVPAKAMYLTAGGGISWEAPAKEGKGETFDEYVSDPAKPVPYRPRPVDAEDGTGWRTWLVTDQRFVDGRPDVLTYETEPLKEDLKVAGEPMVHLFASTSGTDSDWAVKVIDVYPDDEVLRADNGGAFAGVVGVAPDMRGYELPISTDIFRGRYRTSFEHPAAIKAGEPLEYKFALPMVNHVFKAGHRVMVQVQSTLFPLYDRNPQTFVPNIMEAKPGDYVKATQRVWHTAGEATYVSMPVVP
jgi:putative CocE/NonD family hydrolase